MTGFLPARFGPEEHSRTAYPLAGAHLAVACNECHLPKGAGAAKADAARGAARRGPVFRLGAKRCAECHEDPHGKDAWSRVARPDEGKASDRRGKGADAAPPGRTDASVPAGPGQASSGTARSGARGECEACHRVESWRQVSFDHAATRFALSGRHARVTCVSCHRLAEPKGSVTKWRFAGLSMACAACHRDPHEGQFVSNGGPVACERCHTTNDTRATGFDHARDSAYALDGAHKRLDCAVCHRTETRDGRKFVRYKPLPKTCRGCHGKSTPPGQGGRP